MLKIRMWLLFYFKQTNAALRKLIISIITRHLIIYYKL